MSFKNNFNGRFLWGALWAALSLACQAQNAMTPAQALDYRRVGDLHLSPDGSKLLYVMYSYRWDWQPHLWLMDITQRQFARNDAH